jgi:hypothetical protein
MGQKSAAKRLTVGQLKLVDKHGTRRALGDPRGRASPLVFRQWQKRALEHVTGQ